MENLESYNKSLTVQYRETGDYIVLEKLIVTELLCPICDYYNAIKLIRENYSKYFSFDLIVIGAYLVSEWTSEHNEFLDVLNAIRDKLGNKEQSLIWWLNAVHLQFRKKDYMLSDEYKCCLINSVSSDKTGVFNLLAYAECISECDFSKKDILNNVKKVFKQDEMMPLKEYVDVKLYIAEHIWGTQISNIVFETVVERMNGIFSINS